MSDRTARVLAAISIGLACVSVVVSLYSLSVMQETHDQLQALTDGVSRALASQRASEVPLRPPPPALDPGE